jgi:hypothetical protein
MENGQGKRAYPYHEHKLDDRRTEEIVGLIGDAFERSSITQAEYDALVAKVEEAKTLLKFPDLLDGITAEPLMMLKENVRG